MCLSEMKKLFEAIQNTPKQPQESQSEFKEEEISSGELGAFFIGID